MKVFIASDHGGFNYKAEIKKFLAKKNFEVEDLGPVECSSVDYPDKALILRVVPSWGSLTQDEQRRWYDCNTGDLIRLAYGQAVAPFDQPPFVIHLLVPADEWTDENLRQIEEACRSRGVEAGTSNTYSVSASDRFVVPANPKPGVRYPKWYCR